MKNHEALNGDIVCIDAHQHRPRMAACYLIGSDGHCAFVESETSLSVPHLLAVLDERGVPRAAVDYVMPTHVHLDHASGAGALLRVLPNARLVIHPRGARHMIDPSKLIAGATAVYGVEIMRATYGEIVPVPESRVVIADVAADRDFRSTSAAAGCSSSTRLATRDTTMRSGTKRPAAGSRATYSACPTASSTTATACT